MISCLFKSMLPLQVCGVYNTDHKMIGILLVVYSYPNRTKHAQTAWVCIPVVMNFHSDKKSRIVHDLKIKIKVLKAGLQNKRV